MGDIEKNRERRGKLYAKHHGEPGHVFPGRGGSVQLEAFGLDFSRDDDSEDLGYALLTNGMSDRPMHLDAKAEQARAEGKVKARAELLWYVRDLDDGVLHNLRWLADFPFIDKTWLGPGHTIPMPEPVFPGSALTTFFFLRPILSLHRELAAALTVEKEPVELLVVHLLTPEELAVKRQQGADAILDLFDANAYPLLFDPDRKSYA